MLQMLGRRRRQHLGVDGRLEVTDGQDLAEQVAGLGVLVGQHLDARVLQL